MKYRMVIEGNQEAIFKVFKESFKQDYQRIKGKELDENKLKKGFTYQKNASKKENKVNQATIKLLEYKEPSCYKVFYESEKSRKITGYSLKQVDEDHVEMIVEEVLDQVKYEEDGSKKYIAKIKKNDDIKDAGFFKKRQYRYLSKIGKENKVATQ